MSATPPSVGSQPPDRRRLALRLPYAATSARTARRMLGRDLDQVRVPPALVGDAQLVISELIANAVEHGRPLPGDTIAVTWTLDVDSVEIRVSDGGSRAPLAPDLPPPTALRGRGLALVAALSTRWWVEGSRNTTICAVLAA